MADETEITGAHPVPPRAASGPAAPRAGRPAAPPPGSPAPGPPPPPTLAPPPALIRDIWPWLGLLALLAVAGLLLWLFVFRGHHQPVVPAVVGMPRQQAIARLTNKGYAVTAVLGPAAKPSGIVVSQKPGGGSRLPKGKRVTIHVSNGTRVPAAPTTTTAATTQTATTATTTATAAVPNVVGQDMASGAGQVEAAGFVSETAPTTSSQAQGQIVRESPSGQAPAGSTIRLTIAVGSNRPQQTVPNVVGRKAADARAALLAAKLTVRTTYRDASGKDVGNVVSESPSGGKLPAYSQVTVTVGR